MDIKQIFADWTGKLSQGFGVADDLRCAAMEAQECGIERAVYIAEAVELGFNKGTAGRCWAYVKEQA